MREAVDDSQRSGRNHGQKWQQCVVYPFSKISKISGKQAGPVWLIHFLKFPKPV
jgi:hypothetical protein